VSLPLAQVEIRNRSDSCEANNGFCPDWIVHHLDRYVSPFWQHLFLVVVSVGLGFAIAFALALAAHRQRRLVGPITQVTGILYTIPSLAFFFLLLPITGRGNTTALIALTAYTLLILFRNIVDGLDGVPAEARDAGRGMGLTERQLLWRVELPLALPLLFAGIRTGSLYIIATATLAGIVGGGGLGDIIVNQASYRLAGVIGAALCVSALAFAVDALLAAVQRAMTPPGLRGRIPSLEPDTSTRPAAV
jgi:osmoprotectant transport system permease protein